jgi:hypothetical protein
MSAPPPPDATPSQGSGLFYKDGREIPPTHPDHGPMHLLPRQEDGSFAAYYYCSKAELYDMKVPVPPPRRQRRDGFSADRQEEFLEAIRGGASGREAARRIGISPTTAYNLYNSADGAAFKAAWDEAARVTDIVLEDTAFDRAVNGQEEVVYHQGQRVGVRWKYDNKLLMQLLRARNPLKYAPLSEIEGWLRHRGIAPPPDVDGALDRLHAAEAQWGRRLPGEEAPARIGSDGAQARPGAAPCEVAASGAGPLLPAAGEVPPLESTSSTSPGIGQPQDVSVASTSSTSSETGQAEETAAESTSSTSPETGQAEEAAAESTSSTSPAIGQEEPRSAAAEPPGAESNPGVIPYRPPPRPRTFLAPS